MEDSEPTSTVAVESVPEAEFSVPANISALNDLDESETYDNNSLSDECTDDERKQEKYHDRNKELEDTSKDQDDIDQQMPESDIDGKFVLFLYFL